jgi:subtilisin family serine protease
VPCFYPGRILVKPTQDSDGPLYLAKNIEKVLGGSDFEYEHGVEDVLRANDLKLPDNFRHNTLPFVARVPEGAEFEFAERIARLPQIGAVIPDYEVRASSPVKINSTVLDAAVTAMHAKPGGPTCGSGCVVGILDSGIDLSSVPGLHVDPVQYDALDPRGGRKPPADSNGHGTLVSCIVGHVAPAARLISVRTMDDKSTVSSVLAAMYLAQAAGPCDVLNLSLSIDCGADPCKRCGTPSTSSANLLQLEYFFDHFMQQTPSTVLVAAAGNNVSQLAHPAAFDRIIAVGSFNYRRSVPLSSFRQVPSNRYIMAPGGEGKVGLAYAQHAGFSRPQYLYGTSFATAFVTGFAAKTICQLKSNSCQSKQLLSAQPAPGFAGPMAAVLGELNARAWRTWATYNASQHGMGALHF